MVTCCVQTTEEEVMEPTLLVVPSPDSSVSSVDVDSTDGLASAQHRGLVSARVTMVT